METKELTSRKWRLERYDASKRDVWNRFVETSANGVFLFNRSYMDYHSDRFRDCSLMAYRDGTLLCVLPAEVDADGVLHSHRGLTYSGWVVSRYHFDGSDMLDLFGELEFWMRDNGIKALDYKPVPWIYTGTPAQEDLYALFRKKAVRTECNLSSAIDLSSPRLFNAQQTRNVKKGLKNGGIICGDVPVESFHKLLAACLEERHGATPVHSSAELELLKRRFPENIKIAGCGRNGELEAAVCLYITPSCRHCQYIASSPEGRKNGMLALLFDWLIKESVKAGCRYFDFGTSNEGGGEWLNEGLLHQKYGLGGRGVAYERYLWEIGGNSD